MRHLLIIVRELIQETMILETPSFHFYFYFNYCVKSSFYIIMIDETIVDKKTSQSELILCQLGTKPMGKNLTTEHSHGVIIDSYFLVSDILECLKKKSISVSRHSILPCTGVCATHDNFACSLALVVIAWASSSVAQHSGVGQQEYPKTILPWQGRA